MVFTLSFLGMTIYDVCDGVLDSVAPRRDKIILQSDVLKLGIIFQLIRQISFESYFAKIGTNDTSRLGKLRVLKSKGSVVFKLIPLIHGFCKNATLFS